MPLGDLNKDVCFDIDGIAYFRLMPGCFFQGRGDDSDFKTGRIQPGHCDTDSVDGNRTFQDDLGQQFFRNLEAELGIVGLLLDGRNLPQTIDVTLDDVSAETALGTHCAFQIDR